MRRNAHERVVSPEEQVAIDAMNLRAWNGPADLKPRVYRNQREKDAWYSIAVENTFRLPETFAPDDVVIDVGSYIGALSVAAYRRGSRSVYAFEIDPWHTEISFVNLAEMRDGIAAYHAAVVRGDKGRARQYHYGGAETCFSWFGQDVPSYSLDDILEEVKEPVRFLKLDVAGAEWSIISTCTKLDRIAEIAGTYRVVADSGVAELQNLPIAMSVGGLRDFFSARGFTVEIQGDDSSGMFFAKRGVGYTFVAPTEKTVPLTIVGNVGATAALADQGTTAGNAGRIFFGRVE